MQIAKLRSGIFIALEQLMVHLQRAQNTLTRLGKSVADKHRSLQEALRERENALRNLLASSRVAIVVTNSDRRFVAANPKALDLFGISEKNLPKFTIDAFLPLGQIIDFERNGPPFIRGEEKRGRCNIRRLDGSLRIAEYTFVANFAPGRHLSSFHEISLEKAQVKFIEKCKPDDSEPQIPAGYCEGTRKLID
jgi:PAS domain S-box-containing protein